MLRQKYVTWTLCCATYKLKNYNNSKVTATKQGRVPDLSQTWISRNLRLIGKNGKLILTARRRDGDRSEIKNKQLSIFSQYFGL